VSTPAKKSLDAILGVIRDAQDAALVRAAVMDLGYEKDEAVYPVLIDKLSDKNPGIQHAAVISLGRYGRAEAIDELTKPKIFRSPQSDIRWAAVAAIGKLGDSRVIDCLLKAVEDPEWIVRTQAVTELIGKVRDIIERKDVKLARVLVHMLGLKNEEIVGLAIDGFKELECECTSMLLDSIDNSSATIRANSARALGRLKSRPAVPYLIELLQDSSWEVRARAAEALGSIGDKASIEPLVQKIKDHAAKVQEAAGAALIKFGKAATMPLLNTLALERDKFALKAVLLLLGRIGDPKAVPALIAHLGSGYYIVRQAALTALIRFGGAIVNLLVPLLSFNRSMIDELRKDAALHTLPEPQMRAIKALGGLEDHRAVHLLKQLVEEGLPDVQEAATAALGQIGCAAWRRCCALKVLAEIGKADLVPRIVPSLEDDSDNVRYEAVKAIGRLGGPDALAPILRASAEDRADFIRAEAFRVLRTIGAGQPSVPEAAIRALDDKARDVRAQAAAILGVFNDKKSLPLLLKAMADAHWSVRESAENALLNFGAEAVPPLLGALESPLWTTRFRAARLLGELGDPAAVPALQKIIASKDEQDDVRVNAEAALRKLIH
jgi:HEAT repeat protein